MKLPCTECITLPICKALYRQLILDKASELVPREALEEKCSILSDFLNTYGTLRASHLACLHYFMQKGMIL